MIKFDIEKINEQLKENAVTLKRKFNLDDPSSFSIPALGWDIVNGNLVKKEILANRHFIQTGFKRTFKITLEENTFILACGEIRLQTGLDASRLKEIIHNLQVYYVIGDYSEKIHELIQELEKEAQNLSLRLPFNSLLSDVLDKAYKLCPAIQNEFLTATKSVATGTKAIRNVIKHLLNNEELKEGSLEQDIFKELFTTDNEKIKKLKSEIEEYINNADNKENLQKLYDELNQPPYGISNSIISLLLLDILLKLSDKVSLFEKNIFQLEISDLLYDRLMANPQNFELQKNVFTGEKKTYLEKFSKIACCKQTDNLLDVTKSIFYRIKNLDKYTQNTSRLSSQTLKLRNAILNAKEPNKLVFNDIPIALGFKSFENCDDNFFKILENSINELDNCYLELVKEIENFLFGSFALKSGETNKKKLADKFKKVEEFISDDELKIISNNMKIENLTYERWIERFATVVNKKNVPKNWSDNDLADFKQKVVWISNEIKRLELLHSQSKGLKISFKFNDELKALLNKINTLPQVQRLALVNCIEVN
ncbi:MAG: hypothetical protein WC197_07105 [Candidatus Gastranaerophilaceae bacterium]